MTKSKIIYSFLSVFLIALGGIFFTSSGTVEQSNAELIAKLSAELADVKEELTSLENPNGNEAVPLVSMDPFIGEVVLFAGDFAPRGWAFCNGQLLSIAQHSALFSILGTTFGGDGRTSFALPDLRGRSPIGAGSGPGLSPIKNGYRSGQESTTLNIFNLPQHTHPTISAVPGFTMNPNETEHKYIEGAESFITVGNKSNTKIDNSALINNMSSGANQDFSIRDPYLGMHYIIAIEGTFPSRN